MLIWELLENVAGPKVLATKRFRKDYNDFAKAYSGFKETFAEFIKSKYKSPLTPFGKKDTVWQSEKGVPGLKNWAHAHIVFGKAMVIYRANTDQILLAAVVDHLSVEGMGIRIRALGDYLSDLTASSFSPLENVALDDDFNIDDYKPDIMDLFYAMAAHEEDKVMLMSFAQGISDDVLEFLAVASPDIPADKLDLSVLRSWASTALSQTQHS